MSIFSKRGEAGSGKEITQGTEQQYTQQSLNELYALGGDLTSYTDTLEALKDYNPEKYDVRYEDVTKIESNPLKGDSTVRTYADPFYDSAEFEAKKSEVLPAFQARLAAITTQRDQPGRNQLLTGSGVLG